VFAVLLAFEKRSPRRGQLFGMYLVLGAGGRFLVEFGRGDYLRHVGPFTPAQVICLVLIPVGVWLLVRAGRKRATGRAATAGGRS
jgi:prolipoprotein diacylglyceryltransferase